MAESGAFTSPVAASLFEAFARGAAWTPRYCDAWCARQAGADRPALQPVKSDDAAKADAKSITADELFQILVAFKRRLESQDFDHHDAKDKGVTLGLRGIHAHGLKVAGGPLNLTALVFPTPLDFSGCVFESGIIINNAKLGPLSLSNAEFTFLSGDSVSISGDLDLFRLDKTEYIDLRGANLTGGLFLSGSMLKKPDGIALNCSTVTVGGGVFLSRGFSADGEVNFNGAFISGPLDCERGSFKNPDGDALNCNAATIGASVFLRYGFSAKGSVVFRRANITGQLSCVDGTFENAHGTALECNSVVVGDSVFLSGKFRALGEINLVHANIGGGLACENASCENENGRALNCDAATIGADVFLREDFVARGEVNLHRATITGNLRCHAGSFAAPRNAPWYAALDLSSAAISGGLYLCQVKQMLGQLDLRDARAEFLVDDGSAWLGDAKLNLDGFRYTRFSNDWAADHGAPKTRTDYETRRKWLERQPTGDLKGKSFKPQPWTQCAAALREMGHTRDANLLLNTRDSLLVWGNSDFWTRLFYLLLWPFAGYGYKTHRAFFWALGLVLSGFVVFSAAEAKGLFWPSPDELAESPKYDPDKGFNPRAYEEFHAIVYTLDVFLPVVDFDQEKYWLPHGRGSAEERAEGGPRIVRALTSVCPGARRFLKWLGPAREGFVGFCTKRIDPLLSWPLKKLDGALDRGLARLWMWLEIFMGWTLLGIVAAGLAGVLQRKVD